MNDRGRAKRMHVWRHNAMLGSVRMTIVNLRGMQRAASTTGESKRLAHEAEMLLERLHASLAHRVDPQNLKTEDVF